LQTDNAAYWEYMRQVVPALFEWHEQPGPWPGAPKGRTRREIIALRRGLPVFRGWGTARQLSEAQRHERRRTLPAPLFDAGPPSRELDELERE
jgi:tRNA (guanine-N7-)-methyltransferase